MDIVNKIIQFEEHGMEEEDTIAFFQELSNNNLLPHLQGSYQRAAQEMIEEGLITLTVEEKFCFTPGSWIVESGMVVTETDHIPIAYMDRNVGNGTTPVERDNNAQLIAMAPAMFKVLSQIEWFASEINSPFCPSCYNTKNSNMKSDGHYEDCELKALIGV